MYVAIAALIALLVPLLMPLLELLAPRRPEGPRDEEALRVGDALPSAAGNDPTKQLSLSRHQWINGVILAIFLPGMLVFAGLFAFLLLALYHLNVSPPPPAVLLSYSGAALVACLMAGFFPGMAAAYLVVQGILRLLFRKRTLLEFEYWEQAKSSQIGLTKRAKACLIFWLALSLALFGACSLVLTMNCHNRADESALVVRDVLAWREEEFPYAEITRVAISTHAWASKKKETVEVFAQLHVWMRDGRSRTFGPMGEDQWQALFDLLQRKAGAPIEVVKLPEDVGR